MFMQDHLTLRLIRLQPSNDWANQGEGLCFLFPKQGAGKYASQLATQTLAPGDVLVFNGANRGTLSGLNGGEVAFHYFTACLEHLVGLLAAKEISLFQELTDAFKGPRLYRASSVLARECHKLLSRAPPQLTLEHRSQLLRIVAAILSEEFKVLRNRRLRPIGVEEHVARVLEDLSSQEILSLSVDELAAKFGCSRRHLNRLFHRYFGTSMAALKMEMRLLKAVALLQAPGAKVISVAEQCGFNHQGLFNSCFRKRFGASPSEWRKETGQAQPSSKPGGPKQEDLSCQMRARGLCPWSDRRSGFRKPPLLNGAHAEPPASPDGKASSCSPYRAGKADQGRNITHDLSGGLRGRP
jgi:AraC-like DNA-binding protein